MSKKMRNVFMVVMLFVVTMTMNSFSVFSSSKYYSLTVEDGTSIGGVNSDGSSSDGEGNNFYAEGDLVTITANTPSEEDGEVFDKWVSDSKNVSFLNAKNITTAFEMPAEDITVTATYSEIEEEEEDTDGDDSSDENEEDTDGDDTDEDVDDTLYKVLIRNTYNDVETVSYYFAGETVDLYARNYTYADFSKWSTSYSEVDFENSRSRETTFVMPDKNVIIVANYDVTELQTEYSVTVIDGYGDGYYQPGERVYIEAIPTKYEEFSYWTSSSDVVFRDSEAEETYFTMIDESVRIIARYNVVDVPKNTVTVTNGIGGGTYMEGDVVTIQASPTYGQEFLYWESPQDVDFYNKQSSTTSFVMPANGVLVYPVFLDYSGTVGNYGYNSNNTTNGQSHVISTSILGGGQVYPSGNVFVNHLAGQTFSIIPDTGYEIAFVVIDGQPLGSVDEYTFKNVIADHTIQVVFRSTNLSSTTVDYLNNPFTDVKTNYWFYSAVTEVYQKGLMSGTSSTTFSPYDGASRASIAALLYRLEGSPPIYLTSNLFPDVYPNQWYTNSIIWCYENAILSGYDDGYFYTNKIVTREELSSILHRYGKYKGLNMSRMADLSTYADSSDIGSWAVPSVSWAIGSNLIYGKEFGFIQPKATTSRAELAVILVELLVHLDM